MMNSSYRSATRLSMSPSRCRTSMVDTLSVMDTSSNYYRCFGCNSKRRADSSFDDLARRSPAGRTRPATCSCPAIPRTCSEPNCTLEDFAATIERAFAAPGLEAR